MYFKYYVSYLNYGVNEIKICRLFDFYKKKNYLMFFGGCKGI